MCEMGSIRYSGPICVFINAVFYRFLCLPERPSGIILLFVNDECFFWCALDFTQFLPFMWIFSLNYYLFFWFNNAYIRRSKDFKFHRKRRWNMLIGKYTCLFQIFVVVSYYYVSAVQMCIRCSSVLNVTTFREK